MAIDLAGMLSGAKSSGDRSTLSPSFPSPVAFIIISDFATWLERVDDSGSAQTILISTPNTRAFSCSVFIKASAAAVSLSERTISLTPSSASASAILLPVAPAPSIVTLLFFNLVPPSLSLISSLYHCTHSLPLRWTALIPPSRSFTTRLNPMSGSEPSSISDAARKSFISSLCGSPRVRPMIFGISRNNLISSSSSSFVSIS